MIERLGRFGQAILKQAHITHGIGWGSATLPEHVKLPCASGTRMC
jgi:hypothetical protein